MELLFHPKFVCFLNFYILITFYWGWISVLPSITQLKLNFWTWKSGLHENLDFMRIWTSWESGLHEIILTLKSIVSLATNRCHTFFFFTTVPKQKQSIKTRLDDEKQPLLHYSSYDFKLVQLLCYLPMNFANYHY